ncbi:uncharacterized protein TNCV_1449741 [Trichonephila clavipes]|nr:uncharacterized protein TNCV_1449741 [Trichonephila clavipes]
MNAIQKERSKKLRDEVENDLKVFKLQAEIRRNNEHHLEQELSFQKSLSDFHKPVTEQLQQQELQWWQKVLNTLLFCVIFVFDFIFRYEIIALT